jgi:murein DD-endopeptidase MepM/ murein hydrolase activator NlpD
MIGKPFDGFIKAKAPYGSISQFFGENPELYSKIPNPPTVAPDGRLLTLIGHNGIDFVAPYGTPLLAVEDGYISEVKDSPLGYGKHIRIFTKEKVEWTYGHLSEIKCSLYQKVKKGDVIGLMGNTGFVVSSHDGNGFWKAGSNKYAGTHLHLGKRIYQGSMPVGYFTNGYFGSVDFLNELPEDGVTEEIRKDNEYEQGLTLLKGIIWVFKKIGIKIENR